MGRARRRWSFHTGAALAALAGAALLWWSIRQADPRQVVDDVRRIGAGIIVVWLLGGLRAFIRAAAWRFCLDREHRIGIGSLFSAYLVGDAIGNVTPFGFLASEPSKIALVRRRVDISASTAALAVENLFYGATVVVMLVAGTIAFVMRFAVPPAVRIASFATLAAAIAAAAGVAWIVATRRRVVSSAVEWMIRRNLAAASLRAQLPRIRRTGDRIFGFTEARGDAVLPILVLEATYHVAAVIEIWFALGLMTGVRPDVLTAFVLEYVNRTITVTFQFVPMWLGVDEAGTSLATTVLALGPAAGVSLALVRKTRIIVWTAIGMVLLLQRGLAANVKDDAEALQ